MRPNALACADVFLMYRVELKVKESAVLLTKSSLVPNAPCGVESHTHRIG